MYTILDPLLLSFGDTKFKTYTNNGSHQYGISLLFWYKHLSSGELIYQEHLPSELVNGEGGGGAE